jgi:hypothetical protein
MAEILQGLPNFAEMPRQLPLPIKTAQQGNLGQNRQRGSQNWQIPEI